jgi:hypothetical protein
MLLSRVSTTTTKCSQDKKSTYTANFHDIQTKPLVSSGHNSPFRPCFRLFASIVLFLSVFFGITNQDDRFMKISNSSYSVSAHNHGSSSRGSLIDHGTNGGIAGNDVRVISTTDRVVDVTSIDNHQLTSIKVRSVGALAHSQRRPVIIIMHQYALHQQQRTIHSCAQLEYFKNKVDDRSLKAGGLQRLTTVDGYVFPLDIIQGLPYLKMTPYSDKELNDLPHLVLTADHPWRHNIFDCTLSDQDEWYQNTTNWSEGLIQSPFDLDSSFK